MRKISTKLKIGIVVACIVCLLIMGSIFYETERVRKLRQGIDIYLRFTLLHAESNITSEYSFELVFNNTTVYNITTSPAVLYLLYHGEKREQLAWDTLYDFEVRTPDYMFVDSNYSLKGAVIIESSTNNLTVKILNSADHYLMGEDLNVQDEYVITTTGEEGSITLKISLRIAVP